MRYAVTSIERGDSGTYVTLRKMRELVNRSLALPIVRGTAVELARRVPPRQRRAQIEAIREFLTERVQFLRDPVGVELLHAPDLLLRWIAERYYVTVDCDDVAMLGAALGKAMGLKARFRAVAFLDPNAPYSHVWTELFDGEQWRDLDVTRKYQDASVRAISRDLIYMV